MTKIFEKGIYQAYGERNVGRQFLVLMQDIPNIHKEYEMRGVRKFFDKYRNAIATHRPKPIIFEINHITTENTNNCLKIFPEEIQSRIQTINCYGIGREVMKRILKQANPNLDKSKQEMIANALIDYANGDIRVALNQNPFFIRRFFGKGSIATLTMVNPKKITKKNTKKFGTQNSNASISLLDSAAKEDLGRIAKDFNDTLFHQIGRVLYNKRYCPEEKETVRMHRTKMEDPDILSTLYFRPREDLIDRIYIDQSQFRTRLFDWYLNHTGDIADVCKITENWAKISYYERNKYNESNKTHGEH